MSIKTFIKAKIAQTIQEFALSAVIYAEDFLFFFLVEKQSAFYFLLDIFFIYVSNAIPKVPNKNKSIGRERERERERESERERKRERERPLT